MSLENNITVILAIVRTHATVEPKQVTPASVSYLKYSFCIKLKEYTACGKDVKVKSFLLL
jgi:hypothetical protein